MIRRVLLSFFIIFVLLLNFSGTLYGVQITTQHQAKKHPAQKIEISISTTKIPHTINALAIDITAHFSFKTYSLHPPSNFEYSTLEIYSMNTLIQKLNSSKTFPSIMLRVVFRGKINDSFSSKIKLFFENYLDITFAYSKIYRDGDKFHDVCYYSYLSNDKLNYIVKDFYKKTENYTYSKTFNMAYLYHLYKKYGAGGNFGFIHYYEIDNSGRLEGNIEISNSTVEEYKDGLHTWNLLKILNLTYIPPGVVIIEGNAMQTYKHTDFYFKSLKTNVPYTVENTTYYNITKAFEVHIDATTNITQLVITFETKENYNWEDFMTDYGGFIICGSVLLVPVAIVAILLNIRRRRMVKNEK